MRLFERPAGRQAAIFAEATGLLEDGLDRELVLGLYPADAAWLGPLLSAEEGVSAAAARTQPSYYFEASLKQKFVTAGTRRAQTPVAAAPVRPVRMALAAGGMAAALAAAGAITLGFVTSEDASEGEWDYVFKATRDRIDDTLSQRGDPIEFHLRQSDAHVYAITQQLSSAGDDIDQATLDALQAEAIELRKLAEARPFDPAQQEKVKAYEERVVGILTEVRQAPNAPAAVVEKVDKTIEVVQAAVAAATGGGVKPLPEPSPAASQTPTPTVTATATPSPTPTPEATATESDTVTPTASPSAQPSATPSPTATGTAASQ